MSRRRRIATRIAAGAVVAIFGVMLATRALWNPPGVASAPSDPPRLRTELELREGRLYVSGQSKTFDGMLVEDYSIERRKLEIEIRDGVAHGLSRGWFADGQIEVEETFLDGVSSGTRTRWHENGKRKSLATIQNGLVVGEYLEWYENGQLATQMMVDRGQPAGLVESWHPSGAVRSHVRFEDGKQVSQQFFPDSAPPNAPRKIEVSVTLQ